MPLQLQKLLGGLAVSLARRIKICEHKRIWKFDNTNPPVLKEEGLEKGIAEGEGVEKVRIEGITEGKNKKAIEIARNLLAQNIDIQTLFIVTGL